MNVSSEERKGLGSDPHGSLTCGTKVSRPRKPGIADSEGYSSGYASSIIGRGRVFWQTGTRRRLYGAWDERDRP